MASPPSRVEQRIKIGLIILGIAIVVIVVVLYLLPAFRLQLGQTLRIVPGADAVKVASAKDARLIVISEPVQTELSGIRYREEARYLMHYGPGPKLSLIDLRNGKEVPLPIAGRPSVEISRDRTKLLFRTERSVVLDLASDKVTEVQGTPPGQWSDQVYIPSGACPGSSPHDKYTFCILKGGASNTIYLFGNWQVNVKPYATTVSGNGVFRGRGFLPIVGFAPDDSSIYIYSEYDIWKVALK